LKSNEAGSAAFLQ